VLELGGDDLLVAEIPFRVTLRPTHVRVVYSWGVASRHAKTRGLRDATG
jgi:hypothetical protein